MASHDISSQVAELLALGVSEDRILAAHERVLNRGDVWSAANRAAETAVDDLLRRARAWNAPPPAVRPATQRQADYIRDLGGEPTEGMSVTDASGMIEQLKARRAGRRHGVEGEVWD